MALVRRRHRRLWDPFANLLDFNEELNRMFAPVLARRTDIEPRGFFMDFVPALNVAENKDGYVVRAELPGLDKDAVHVTYRAGALILSGEKKCEEKEEEENYYLCERSFGKFERVIDLPKTVEPDKIKATYNDGILEVTVPKKEEAKPKEISVNIK